MLHTRLKRLQRELKKKRVKAVLVSAPGDIFYLTGAPPEGIMLLVRPDDQVLFTARMFKDQLIQAVGAFEIRVCKDFAKEFALYIAKNDIRSVAVDHNHITMQMARSLQKIPRVRIKALPSMVQPLRMIKDAGEIKRIRQACRITVRIFSRMRQRMTKGKCESDLRSELDMLFFKAGVEPAFDTIVASGSGSAQPHHMPGMNRVSIPGVILVDAGARYKGYAADLTRTFYLGKISEFYRQIYRFVKQAKAAAQACVRHGAAASSVDAAARRVFEKAGLEKYFLHSTGHGVGIDVHELPLIAPGSRDVLKSGMVITIEPGLYFPGKFGVRIEDTLLVTKKGYTILTR